MPARGLGTHVRKTHRCVVAIMGRYSRYISLAGGRDCVEKDEPRRIQLSRRKGWRLPPNTVSVARPGKYGNIFKVGCNPSEFSAALPSHCSSVEQAVECFRYYAETRTALTRGAWISPLRGKNLACWCKIGQACHADVLLELANKDTPHAD